MIIPPAGGLRMHWGLVHSSVFVCFTLPCVITEQFSTHPDGADGESTWHSVYQIPEDKACHWRPNLLKLGSRRFGYYLKFQ